MGSESILKVHYLFNLFLFSSFRKIYIIRWYLFGLHIIYVLDLIIYVLEGKMFKLFLSEHL